MVDYDFDVTIVTTRTEYISQSIAYNIGTIRNATLTIPAACYDWIGDYDFYMSADGGVHWEQVFLGQNHSFTNTGIDLRYRIVGNTGSTLRLRLSDGTDVPWTVTYST